MGAGGRRLRMLGNVTSPGKSSPLSRPDGPLWSGSDDLSEALLPRKTEPVERQTSWARGIVLAAGMLLVSYLVFVLIPNNLLTYLSTRTVPFTRDLLVTLWWVVAFVGACWLFFRLQRKLDR